MSSPLSAGVSSIGSHSGEKLSGVMGFHDMNSWVRDLSEIACATPYKPNTNREESETTDYRKQ
jgi:hypothetical protein